LEITEQDLRKAHTERVKRLHAVEIAAVLKRDGSPKHVFIGHCYRNAVFLRLRGLERGIAACLSANEPVSAIILARQFVETAAHYVSTSLYIERQLRKSPPDLKRIDERLGSAVFGSKLSGIEDGYAAEQVLNCIDDTDAHIGKLMPEVAARERRPMRSGYDMDSEFTHPNGFAFQYHMDIQDSEGVISHVQFGEHAHPLAHTIAPRVRRALLIIDILLLRDREFVELLAKHEGEEASS
jgi:hypothetical protein